MVTAVTDTVHPPLDVHGRYILGVVRKVSNQNGRVRSVPKTGTSIQPTEHGEHTIKVLEFNFGLESELLNRLTSFEVAVEDFEKTANGTLSGNIRSAIMIQKAPEALNNHTVQLVPKEEITCRHSICWRDSRWQETHSSGRQ